ncbi:division plane positioning ATPase MipZ [Escherichia coli]|uniref:division plane positioning ATPase MipZ n=1 Tax=Escherichia coli TaxID=562 RepID=UPI001CC7D46E|nr:division plane positioning ATPase MipZ [Escherichia coli]
MIIVLGSQKGGVGKSTLAVSIAAYLMSLGNRVIIVDADDQKSVLTWYNNRPEDLPHIPVTGATGNIKAMLKEHEKSYDFVIADCAGRDSAEMRSGLMAADVFISPLRPSQMDLDVVPHTCSVFTAEAAFINGGTAGLDNTKKSSDKSSVVSKAKPVSISFFEENLKDIDALITAEMVSGKGRVNRSDVVRAAVEALKTLSKTEVSRLIAEVKQR